MADMTIKEILENNVLAKKILTDYVFGDFDIKSIDKYVDKSVTDETTRKLYAEALLTKALQKAIIALNKWVD